MKYMLSMLQLEMNLYVNIHTNGLLKLYTADMPSFKPILQPIADDWLNMFVSIRYSTMIFCVILRNAIIQRRVRNALYSGLLCNDLLFDKLQNFWP